MILEDIYIYSYIFYPWVFIGYVALISIIRTLYLRVKGYDKWWLGIIPFSHYYYRRDICGTHIIWLVLLGICELIGITYSVFAWVPAWIFNALINMQFASIYADETNPKVFAFVPLAKYVLMVKEVIKCQK